MMDKKKSIIQNKNSGDYAPKQPVKKNQTSNNPSAERHQENLVCSSELFEKDLKAIVDDTAREDH